MQTQLYYPDGESIGNADPVALTHMFLRKRYILTQKSRAFDLKGPLYEEFFFYLDKFLIKGVDIQFRLF